MPWMISIDQLENVIEKIEKKLYLTGNSEAVGIVRHFFAESREMIYVESDSLHQKASLCCISGSRVVGDGDALRRF